MKYAIFLLVVFLLIGCNSGVSRDEYSTLESRYEELANAYTELKTEYSRVSSYYQSLQSCVDEYLEGYYNSPADCY